MWLYPFSKFSMKAKYLFVFEILFEMWRKKNTPITNIVLFVFVVFIPGIYYLWS